jgi:hypothetical protein
MTRTMKVNLSGREGGEEYALRHEWPPDCFVQGGRMGVVISRKPEGNYLTAYFEAFPGTFIRGEGESLELAEDQAWAKYERYTACPEHDYKPYPRGQGDNPKARYENGAGFCQNCNRFKSKAFTGEELGQFCATCGVGTTWERYGPLARFVGDNGFHLIDDPSPEDEKVWRCEEHAPFREEVDGYFVWLHGSSGLTFSEWRKVRREDAP